MQEQILQLEKQIKDLNQRVGKLQGEFDYICKEKDATEIKFKELTHSKEIHLKSVEVLNVIQKLTKEQIKEKFETMVNYALQFICGPGYNFSLVFDKRGNLQELYFNIQTPNKKEPADPNDTESGGIIDIISFVLRIVLMEISTPKTEGFLILDESLKHLSVEYRPQASLFIKELSKKLNRQIIMITHAPELIDEQFNLLRIE